MSIHQLPNRKPKQPTLVASIKVNDVVYVCPEHDKSFSGVVKARLTDNKFLVVVQTKDSIKEVEVSHYDIKEVDSKFAYHSLMNYRGWHPSTQIAADTATQQQMEGEEELRVARHSLEFLSSQLYNVHRNLVSTHICTALNAIRELEILGEYNAAGNIAETALRTQEKALERIPQKPAADDKDQIEYEFALHARLQHRLMNLGRQELFMYLSERGIKRLMEDFKDEYYECSAKLLPITRVADWDAEIPNKEAIKQNNQESGNK